MTSPMPQYYTADRGIAAGAAAAYRSAVTAADLLAAVGTVTLTDIVAVGVIAASPNNVKVVAGNTYGRATPSTLVAITPTVNHQIKVAFAAVTGATYYDIYLSTDADPKWLARITEAQRAAGCLITAVGTVGAGGAAGSAYAALVGTGLQAGTTAAVNTAYSIPAYVDCTGRQYVDFLIDMSRTGDAVAPALSVVPFYYDGTSYYFGTLTALTFGGATGVFTALQQVLRIEARGYTGVGLIVVSIAGTGASLTVRTVLS